MCLIFGLKLAATAFPLLHKNAPKVDAATNATTQGIIIPIIASVYCDSSSNSSTVETVVGIVVAGAT